ncbi:MAG: aromatic acid exporter family protein [Turicibacter sp.]|nr:aromatic acid exporter family protein [Turicibacter sp.]
MIIRMTKLTVGAFVGILIAYFLGLSNPLTAGIIVLLSLGRTKRSSVEVAFVRVKSVFLALLLASTIFLLVGFTVYSFGLFLFVYVPLVLLFKLEDGLIIGSVLSTHLITAATIDVSILFNTVMLFIIGVLVALLFNLYVPSVSKDIKQDERLIEQAFRELLLVMATMMRGDKKFDFERLNEVERLIEQALARSRMNEDNYLFIDVSYHTQYIQMRKVQFGSLRRMFDCVSKVDMTLAQAEMIANVTENFARTLSETNSGEALLVEISQMMAIFQKSELPKSRVEFENRAILFQYLSEFRHVVALKREFTKEYE